MSDLRAGRVVSHVAGVVGLGGTVGTAGGRMGGSGSLRSWMFSGCSQSPMVDMAAPELTQRVCVCVCVDVCNRGLLP